MDMQQWTGCIAGALTRAEFESTLTAGGLVDIVIRETHRVHEHAAAAINPCGQARRPLLLDDRSRGVLRACGQSGVLRGSDRVGSQELRLRMM